MLFWLCLVGVVVAVAVAAREPLKAAVAQLRGHPASPAPTAGTAGPASGTAGASSGTAASSPASRESPRVTIAPLTDRERAAETRVPPAPVSPSTTPPANPAVTASADRAAAAVPDHPSVRKARLYFATVDAAGRIALKSVIRPIPASDSPLTDTLASLLKGPTAQELNLGMVSMIPTDARLRSAVVKGDTAVLDFNESFRFNPQGLEAIDAQLRQVVYAATEFPSVKKVQIEIEGATVRSLGAEGGLRLDAPLTRDSFR